MTHCIVIVIHWLIKHLLSPSTSGIIKEPPKPNKSKALCNLSCKNNDRDKYLRDMDPSHNDQFLQLRHFLCVSSLQRTLENKCKDLCRWSCKINNDDEYPRDLDPSRNKYELLTKCEVKMAGYWPSSFFACLWTETESRSMYTQNKARPTSSHLGRTSLDFLYGFWVNFSCRTQVLIPNGQDGSILLAWVANHSVEFSSTCPLTELYVAMEMSC